jgi:prevent-host-death family protein
VLRAVSSNEAKQWWGSILRQVDEGAEVVVESHGRAQAVVVSIAAYEELKALREQKRRADVLERFRALREQQAGLNADLTEDQAMELADRFAHEMIDDLAAEGKLVFERDRT